MDIATIWSFFVKSSLIITRGRSNFTELLFPTLVIHLAEVWVEEKKR